MAICTYDVILPRQRGVVKRTFGILGIQTAVAVRYASPAVRAGETPMQPVAGDVPLGGISPCAAPGASSGRRGSGCADCCRRRSIAGAYRW